MPVFCNPYPSADRAAGPILPADVDKPHRCPACWKIPDAAKKTGAAVPGVVYECVYPWRKDARPCGTRWRLAPEGLKR